ncbi:hypothetical protein KIW84_075109 [Lathyrus oleraceus]|uniref:MHD1 domain-containing protein n=1 Tax=Pisum sativum TaxID=3888 RepID=A0A9D4VSW3_PEA|nr:hypothetical protein KIW84_075109 [Pisum sativum]
MANLGGQVASIQCDSAGHVDRMASTNQIDEYCERAQTSQSAVSSAQDLPMPSGINQINPRDSAMQISALETGTAPHPSVTFNPSLHGTPLKVLRNVWTNVSCMQQPTALKAPSHPQPNSIFETATRPQKPHVEDSESDANEHSEKQMLLEVVDAADGTASASCVKERVVKSTPDASQSSSAARLSVSRNFVTRDDAHDLEGEISDSEPVSSGSCPVDSGCLLLSSDHGATTLSNKAPHVPIERHLRLEDDDEDPKKKDASYSSINALIEGVKYSKSDDFGMNLLTSATTPNDVNSSMNEKLVFNPILERWHPLTAGVAVATLHVCYGNELKKYAKGITELTPDAIEVLMDADKLEKELVQIAVEDSVDSEDGGRSIIMEIQPYEAEAIIANLVKSWINIRVDRLVELVDRIMHQEAWNPQENKEGFAPSAIQVLRFIGDTVATFCLNFFYFICCVKMDTGTMLKTEKQAITIGIFVSAFAFAIPLGLSFAFTNFVSMDKTLASALPLIAISQSIIVLISISVLLTELKILNTNVVRLALSSAMFTNVVILPLITVIFAVMQVKTANKSIVTLLWILLSIGSLLVVIFYVMRSTIIWYVSRLNGKPIDEFCIVCIIMCVLFTAFCSEFIGQHYSMGPIFLGLVVPEGPPLGSTLISKMETLTGGFLYPLYLAVSGLQTDIFKINFRAAWIIIVIVIVAFLVKIIGVIFQGHYYKVPMKDCVVIGLVFIGRGIAELSMYNLMKNNQLLTGQLFSFMVLTLILINGIITPLVKLTYNSSAEYRSGKKISIQHTKQDSEPRIMVCFNKNEDIPTMFNIIEASCASRQSNVEVIAVHLVELLGRSMPLLLAHQPNDTLLVTNCDSTQLDNALEQYTQLNEGCAHVQSFTSICDFDIIHEDVCGISLDRRANILIMPFHKRWEIDGTVDVKNRGVQTINIKVLERAPCSVGILIDRAILSGSPSLLIGKSTTMPNIFDLEKVTRDTVYSNNEAINDFPDSPQEIPHFISEPHELNLGCVSPSDVFASKQISKSEACSPPSASPILERDPHTSDNFALDHLVGIQTFIDSSTVNDTVSPPINTHKESFNNIFTPVELIKKGDKVGSSEAALLAKFGIRPFSYGLLVLSVYDNGSVFSPEVLDLTDDDLVAKFAIGISMVTSLSLAISYPTLSAPPHMFVNAYKNVLAIAVAIEYSYPEADEVKEYLKDPSKFVVAPAAPANITYDEPATAKEEKKEEPEEESSKVSRILHMDSLKGHHKGLENFIQSYLCEEQKDLVKLVDAKLDQEYELVVTTYVGLYRYRIGDVLKVAGFKNKAPQFNFVCRKHCTKHPCRQSRRG